MKIEKLLVRLTAVFFLVYGVLFALFPALYSDLVTGSVPSTASGLIDMRATYGGMAIAVGIVMLLLANNVKTLSLGLLTMIVVLLAMAFTRTIGIIVDGNPNGLMYTYLAAEIVPSIVAIVLYRRMGGGLSALGR